MLLQMRGVFCFGHLLSTNHITSTVFKACLVFLVFVFLDGFWLGIEMCLELRSNRAVEVSAGKGTALVFGST